MNKLSVIFVIFAIGIGMNEALKCYICGGLDGGSCSDPFDATGITSTSCPLGTCLKTKKDDIVIRSCFSWSNNECTEEDGGTFCACDTDNCNSAGYAQASIVALLASSVVSFLFY